MVVVSIGWRRVLAGGGGRWSAMDVENGGWRWRPVVSSDCGGGRWWECRQWSEAVVVVADGGWWRLAVANDSGGDVQQVVASLLLSSMAIVYAKMIKATPVSEIYLTSLVQDKEPILNLEQDVTSHLVLNKIKELREKYASFRRVRGDGNCFFRAFKFAYLEHILLMNDMSEANRILAKVEEFKFRILVDHMAPSETLISDYDAFCNIVTLVSSSAENRISHAVLLRWSKDEDGYSDPAIRFLRMVTSNEICKRPNHFEQSIQGLLSDNAMTVQKFCEIEVEPMDKDVDNVQIIAFVDALGVPIRIEYVQDSEHKLNHYDFGIEASPLEEPYITLLYRPGHYDILYTKEYHVVVPEPVEVVLKDPEISKKEPQTIAKVPATSEMDPPKKDKDMFTSLRTYIRRNIKGTDEEL